MVPEGGESIDPAEPDATLPHALDIDYISKTTLETAAFPVLPTCLVLLNIKRRYTNRSSSLGASAEAQYGGATVCL